MTRRMDDALFEGMPQAMAISSARNFLESRPSSPSLTSIFPLVHYGRIGYRTMSFNYSRIFSGRVLQRQLYCDHRFTHISLRCPVGVAESRRDLWA